MLAELDKGILEYLMAVGIRKPGRERIESIVQAAKYLLQEDIEAVFVADQVDDSGDQLFVGLWLFTKNYVLEAPRFMHSNDFDVVRLSTISRVDIRPKDFTFGAEPTSKSRLSVEASFNLGMISGTLTATRNNCAHLAKIVKERFIALPAPE